MITLADEALHQPDDRPHWQESYYFNWSDPAQDLFGLARIGYRFNQQQIDGLYLAIQRGRPLMIYPAVHLPLRDSWSELHPEGGLRSGKLAFRMNRPLQEWRLTLSGVRGFDLCWQALNEPFDYHADGRAVPPDVAAQHFEQTGRVTGWVRTPDGELPITGLGQRDKSWGVRDWARIEGWSWISAQFSEQLSFNLWQGWFGGQRYLNGFLWSAGENRAVSELEISFVRRSAPEVPEEVELSFSDSRGDRWLVRGLARGHFPLVKNGLWLQETQMSFQLSGPDGEHYGLGVFENAVHVGRVGALLRSSRLIRCAMQLLWN